MRTKIIVHCSDTYAHMLVDAETIKRWHVDDNGWSDIGYHYVITRKGEVEKGRPDSVNGAHARGHNDAIGICLVGGRGENNEPDANFTLAQYNALSRLIDELQTQYGKMKIMGHRDVSSKACPSFNVQALLDL